jgi:hypothetical protein
LLHIDNFKSEVIFLFIGKRHDAIGPFPIKVNPTIGTPYHNVAISYQILTVEACQKEPSVTCNSIPAQPSCVWYNLQVTLPNSVSTVQQFVYYINTLKMEKKILLQQ